MTDSKQPSILVAAPTSIHKDYCLKEWAEQYNNFTYPNKNILVVDNSPNKTHLKVLNEHINGKVVRLRKGKHLREIVCNCQNYIRQYVLDNNYDYLLFAETDIFIDNNPDIIEHLVARSVANNIPIVGIPYFTFHGEKTRYLAMHLEELHIGAAKSQIMRPDWAIHFHDGQFKPAYQFGFGFVLIHRTVLERIPFRINKEDDGLNAYSDSYWHEDVFLSKTPAYLDTSFVARHENSHWGDIYKKEKRG